MAKQKPTRIMASDIEVHCSYDRITDIVDLIPNPRNPNTHPDKQVALLAKIIRQQGWRNPIVVSKRSGFITKGHGRLQAAQLLQVINVPVDFQEYKDEATEFADMVADNRIAEISEIDTTMLKDLLESMDDGEFDMDLTGFDMEELESLITTLGAYSAKVEAPIYEPDGEKPAPSDLMDWSKVEDLEDRISKSGVEGQLKGFLLAAAQRHCVFNYHLIADYYAHSDPEVQSLMEDSALIIIDFDKAIELGYVKLTKKLQEQYGVENPAK